MLAEGQSNWQTVHMSQLELSAMTDEALQADFMHL